MHIGGCLGACDVGCLWCCIRVWPGRRRPKHENGNPTGKVMQDLFKGGLKRVISYGWGLPFVMLFLFICCLLKKKNWILSLFRKTTVLAVLLYQLEYFWIYSTVVDQQFQDCELRKVYLDFGHIFLNLDAVLVADVHVGNRNFAITIFFFSLLLLISSC